MPEIAPFTKAWIGGNIVPLLIVQQLKPGGSDELGAAAQLQVKVPDPPLAVSWKKVSSNERPPEAFTLWAWPYRSPTAPPEGGPEVIVRFEAALAVTETDWEASPPVPVQARLYVTVPDDDGVTDLAPLMDSEPDQSFSLGVAVAVQDVAFSLDQVRVTDWPNVTELEDAEIVTVGRTVPPP